MTQELKKTEQGYALLFTVIMVSLILSLSIGLSNAVYQQIVLSSVAQNSDLAFYESDSATECALYADQNPSENIFYPSNSQSTYSCGVDANGNSQTLSFSHQSTTDGNGNTVDEYDLAPQSPLSTSLNPCFTISVFKSTGALSTTDIKARGYNICLNTNPQTVEREIDVTY
jgi:hypothetical protein